MPARIVAWLQARGGLAWTVIWVSGSRVTMLGFSLLGSIIVYRYLSASSLAAAGQFAISMAIVRILTSSIGGTADLVVLRRVPVLAQSDPDGVADVVRSAFLLRSFTLCCVCAIGIASQSWFAERFLDGTGQEALVPLICLAAVGELLLRSVLVYFQATERFDRFVTFEAVFQMTRLMAILILAATDLLSVTAILAGYAILGFCCTALAAAWLPSSLFSVRPIPWPVVRDAAHFFGWTMFGFGLAASTDRLDLFLIGRFLGAEEAGLYGGVLTLAVIPDFVGGLLSTVLQPRVIRLYQTNGDLPSFTRRLMLVMIPAGIVTTVGLAFAADLVVSLALGNKFTPGVPAFIIVAGASVAWQVLTPVPAMLISMTAPRTSTVLILVQLAMMLAGGYALIPVYGITGAAIVVAVSRITIAISILVIGARMMLRPVPAGALSTH